MCFRPVHNATHFSMLLLYCYCLFFDLLIKCIKFLVMFFMDPIYTLIGVSFKDFSSTSLLVPIFKGSDVKKLR